MEQQLRIEQFVYCSCGRPLLGNERASGHCQRCEDNQAIAEEIQEEYFEQRARLPVAQRDVLVTEKDDNCPF